MSSLWNRRRFITNATLATSGLATASAFPRLGFAQTAPALITSERMRPKVPYGAAVGDVTDNRAIIWSRCDRPARMVVEYADNELFRNAQRANLQPAAIQNSDYTARVELTNLPPGQQFYRVTFQDLADASYVSEPVIGRFRSPPMKGDRDVFFAWSGDCAGQGWGINSDWGGMKLYETIRRLNPDFFIHSGDTIYADHPLQSEVKLSDGKIWRNLVTPEKSKVAETLTEFRGNHIYNLLDQNVRRFNAEVPMLIQWDDHEVVNNWYPGKQLTEDDRYSVKSCDRLAARSRQAFLEYTPIRLNSAEPKRIYRAFHYGPLLDIFMLDMRSYRGANSPNRQPVQSAETTFLGNSQILWLKQQLQTSKATWKIIASDMPLGLVVPDGKTNFENVANGDGDALGRELELADLLNFIKRANIRNVVWLTADVHYAAAHYYNPAIAQFTDFNPFWEFVAGPINAGTFGPNALDNTFGPEVKFNSIPASSKVVNLPPSDGFQFFGTIKIDRATQSMTIALHNLEGKVIYTLNLPSV